MGLQIQGQNLLNQGNFEQAEKVYLGMMVGDPDNAYRGLAQLCLTYGKYDEAIENFKMVSDKKFCFDVLTHLGTLMMMKGNIKEAETCFIKALTAIPGYEEALLGLGVVNHLKGNTKNAISNYEKAIGDNKYVHNAWLYYRLGEALKDQGELEESIDALKNAIDVDPYMAESYYALGNIYRSLGDSKETNKYYSKAKECSQKIVAMPHENTQTQINFRKAHAYNCLGHVAFIQGNLEECINNLNLSVGLNPYLPRPYINLGDVFRSQGKLEEAIINYNKALEVKNNIPPSSLSNLYMNLSETLKEQGQGDAAADCLKQSLEMKPNFIDGCNVLGDYLNEKGKYEAALDYFKKANSVKPNEVSYKNIGNSLCALQEDDKAIEAYTQALKLDLNYSEAFNGLGFVLARQGKTEQANNNFNKALLLDPNDVNTYYLKGLVLQIQGKTSETVDIYKVAVKLQMHEDKNKSHFYADRYYKIGLFLARNGWESDAVVCYQKTIRLNKYKCEPHLEWAKILEKSEKYQEALKQYEAAVKIIKYNPEIYLHQGIASETFGINYLAKYSYPKKKNEGFDFEEEKNEDKNPYATIALMYYKDALKRKNDYHEAHFRVAKLQFDEKKYDFALVAFTDAINFCSKNAEYYFFRGQTHFALEDLTEAAKDLEEAVNLDPNNPEYYKKLSNIFRAQRKEDLAIKIDEKYNKLIEKEKEEERKIAEEKKMDEERKNAEDAKERAKITGSQENQDAIQREILKKKKNAVDEKVKNENKGCGLSHCRIF